jgi:hypothetical protein
VGTGYARSTAPGVDSDFLAPEYEKFYAVVPAIEIETMSFSLSIAYSLPLRGGVTARLKSGAGYHLGSLQSDAVWDSRHPVLDRRVRVTGDVGSWGFHFGGGFDIPVSEFLGLCLEGLYRILEFKDFGGWSVQDGHPSLGEMDEYYFPEYAYEIRSVSQTGLSLRLGLRLRF